MSTDTGAPAEAITVAVLKARADAYLAELRLRQARSEGRCAALTRKGTPCQAMGRGHGRRCKLHGGASTGPTTSEGRARIAEAQRRRWASYRAACANTRAA